MTKTAAVIGGGIGGLAAAGGLRRHGWEVDVFERSPDLPKTGTALGMWPSALRALDELGTGDLVRAAGSRQRDGHIRRPGGGRIATVDVGRIERKGGEPLRLVSRPALLAALASVLPAGTVRFGAAAPDARELAGAYDVVVAADGIHSRTRRTLFGEEYGVRYAGAMTWRGTVPVGIGRGGETWGRGAKFGLTPLSPSHTNFYAVLYVPEGRPPAGDVREVLRRHFGDWHDPIPRLIDAVDPATILRHELSYVDPPLPAYVHGNTALIGDAAHAMPPDLGQGACQTLIDAAALVAALAETPGVPAALAAYDRGRRRPSQRIAAMARRASRLGGMRTLWLRDLLTKAALAAGPPA